MCSLQGTCACTQPMNQHQNTPTHPRDSQTRRKVRDAHLWACAHSTQYILWPPAACGQGRGSPWGLASGASLPSGPECAVHACCGRAASSLFLPWQARLWLPAWGRTSLCKVRCTTRLSVRGLALWLHVLMLAPGQAALPGSRKGRPGYSQSWQVAEPGVDGRAGARAAHWLPRAPAPPASRACGSPWARACLSSCF